MSDAIYVTYQVFFLRLLSDGMVAILMTGGEFLCNPIVGREFKELSARSIYCKNNIFITTFIVHLK
jgi:hypothetical protein